jgi:hypothetical protein
MSFHRFLTAAVCGGFLLLGSAQAQTPPKEKPPAAEKSAPKGRGAPKPELRTCKLRLAWWSAPENPPVLALQMDKDRTPFSPDIMALSQVIEYHGEPNAVVLKRTVTAEVDKAGKPIVAWLPYCTIPVGETNTDLAVLLFPSGQDVAQTRVFDFSPEAFPYGTVQLVNFTTAKIAVSIDGTTFVANSRGMARYPKVFDKVSVSRFYMAAAESSGEQRMLRSTTMIFKPTARVLLFAVEIPGAPEDARYHTELITDNMGNKPVAVEAPETASKGKGKAAPDAGGKKAGKAAPKPEQPI